MKKCCGFNLTKKAYKLADQGKDLQKKVTQDLVPAVSEQLSDTVETVRDRLQEVTGEAPVKKSRKGFLFVALSLALAGAAYLLWRRAQPVEDPWAEEYWEDIDVEEFTQDVQDLGEEVADKVGEGAEKVADKAKAAAQAAAEKTDEVVDQAKKAVDQAK